MSPPYSTLPWPKKRHLFKVFKTNKQTNILLWPFTLKPTNNEKNRNCEALVTPPVWPHPRPVSPRRQKAADVSGQSQKASLKGALGPNLAFPQQRNGGVHNPGLFFSVSLAWSRLAARSQPAQIFLSLKTPWTTRPAAFLLALHGQCHGDGAANVDWFVHSTSVH